MNALACSFCYFGSPEDPMNTSLTAGILFMLGILIVVLTTFAKFFLSVRKRSQLIPENR